MRTKLIEFKNRDNLIIPNRGRFLAVLDSIINGGIGKLHVRMDFDGTATKAIVGGKIVPSLISVLRDEDFLGKDYSQKAHALYDKYRAIEIDPQVSDEEKRAAMREWWKIHFGLIIEKGLSKCHIEMASQSARIQLRGGFAAFAALLAKNDVPLVIMSCSGMGEDTIKMVLEKNGALFDNIHIVANRYEWNEKGAAIAVKDPIVHVLNKNEESIRRFPNAYEAIKNRPNVMLLTDSVADITMAEGAKIGNLLSFGFLNTDIDKQKELFKKTFDVILINDAPMDFANEILKLICK